MKIQNFKDDDTENTIRTSNFNEYAFMNMDQIIFSLNLNTVS